MKITIDTKEDSPEEIRRAIQLLGGLVEPKKEKYQNIFDGPAENKESSPSLFETKSEESVFGAIFASPDKENKPKKQEDIRIIPY